MRVAASALSTCAGVLKVSPLRQPSGAGMNPREHHPSVSGGSLHNGRSSVWVFGNNVTPARKLGAVLPVVVKRHRSGNLNPHRRLPNVPIFQGIELEAYAFREIGSVIG